MNNKEFDDVIKNKLESLNTEGTDDAWDLFKEKWDNESVVVEDNSDSSNDYHDLDEKIKTDMQKLRIPFNSKHWIILKEQLESEALFKKKLFVAKSVELVILAFLVLGILNLWPIQNEIHHIAVLNIPMAPSVPVDKETAEVHEAREEARLAEQRAVNNRIYNSTKKLVQRTITSVEKVSSPLARPIILQNTGISKIENSSDTKINIQKNVLSEDAGIDFPFISTEKKENKTEKEEVPSLVKSNEHLIASLLPIEINELELPTRPTVFPDIALVKREDKQAENTYVSFALGPKMNLINSPFDPVYKIDPYNVINTNFNISAKIHKEVGPIELYAGLGYTNTSYEPRLVDELYEPKESQFNVATLENIKFKTFNVPVGVQYNIIDSKNYQFYASAGVDLNVIADSEYEIQDVPVGRGPRPSGPPPSSQSNSNQPVNENAKLSQKEFNKGILSGGSLKDNLYASASVGFGLNWNVSSRSGIFIEPRYSHFISSKGIGPNEDKVHGVSVDLGFRFQLN